MDDASAKLESRSEPVYHHVSRSGCPSVNSNPVYTKNSYTLNTQDMSCLAKITVSSTPDTTQKNFFKTYGKQLKVGVLGKAKSETSQKMVPSIG
jgi:hypothetical protein